MKYDIGSLIKFVKNTGARDEAPRSTPLTVLVVDDEEPVRRFVQRVLQDGGYTMLTAGGGPEALRVAATADGIDILVTDLMMPEMQGDELARRLRQKEPKLKVLYLTGYCDQLFKDKITLWEDEAFLDKPCSIKGLQQAVSLLLFGRVDAARERTAPLEAPDPG